MKNLLLFLLPLLVLTSSACDDDTPDCPDTKLFHKRYTWHVSDPANENDGKPRLDLTWYDAPYSDNLWDATEYYIVVKLIPTEMWLKPHQKDVPDDIKKFIRRNDLPDPSLQFPNP